MKVNPIIVPKTTWINFKNSFDYDKKVLAKENNAYGYVKATNEGLKEILEDLLTKSLLFSL